ncbi:hypothetical protein [Parahaliea mediterranea]|uniref:Nitroreductase domain-containing protein n=1 Tax=Parahaliea mediterranea TaxID=651086 RepID=A0A939DG45_9GAMM|nr:hypothetical protein [Parahaliea mediterranea]MBN7797470.1 hypothetical protein [Parahaliea mediterranea]
MSAWTQETVARLVRYAQLSPSADNMQPFCFQWDGRQLRIAYDQGRVAGHTFGPEAPATLLSLGTTVEAIEQATRLWNHPATFAPTFHDTPDGFEYGALQLEGELPPESGQPLPDPIRHTDRGRYSRRELPSALVQRLRAGVQGGCRMAVHSDRASTRAIAALVQSASELRFQTPELHAWLMDSLRFSEDAAARGDGLDVRTLGLPPGGALMLRCLGNWRRMAFFNRLGGHRAMAGIDAAPVAKAPAVVAVIGPDDRDGALDAGRLLYRGWTWLNEEGVAVHPYYVVSDQVQRLREGSMPQALRERAQRLQAETARQMQLAPGEHLYMLLRVGYAKAAPTPSRRLPLSRVFEVRGGE